MQGLWEHVPEQFAWLLFQKPSQLPSLKFPDNFVFLALFPTQSGPDRWPPSSLSGGTSNQSCQEAPSAPEGRASVSWMDPTAHRKEAVTSRYFISGRFVLFLSLYWLSEKYYFSQWATDETHDDF